MLSLIRSVDKNTIEDSIQHSDTYLESGKIKAFLHGPDHTTRVVKFQTNQEEIIRPVPFARIKVISNE